MKIYLSPSNQNANTYSYGNTNECDQCNRIAEACETALVRCGFEVKRAPKGQDMLKSIGESNAYNPYLHICIHTNAGGGSGPLVMVRQKDSRRLQYANPIYNALYNLTGRGKGYGVRLDTEISGNLAELKNTNALGIYCECEFHDDKDLAKWIVEHVSDIGEAICKGVCEGEGIPYVEPEQPEEDVFYRVQVGAFNDKKNAENMVENLAVDGYDGAFVIEVKKEK